MENTSKLMQVTVNGKVCAYPAGTTYGEIAKDFLYVYQNVILLV